MKFKLGLFVLGLTHSFSVLSQETIFFSKIEIHPNVDNSHKFTKEFIGKGQRISIHFINDNERPEHEIDAFPEPPLTLRDNRANTSCHIIDGGIWSRHQVYLSYDERYLLVSEYSGSSEHLVSYDTQTCELFQQLDVSHLDWDIENNQIHFKPFDLRFFALPIN